VALAPRERNLIIFLVVIAVAAGAFFLLTREGGEEPKGAAPTLTPSPPSVVTPTPPPPERRHRPPPLVVVTGRDPFVPLVVAEAGGGGATTAPAEVGEQPEGPVEVPGPGAEQRRQEGVMVGGHTLTVIDVFTQGGEQVVQVEVDGKTFVAAEGERFARNFEVVSISGSCATFLFGDQTVEACIPHQGK
jgi:hypothetical protein